MSAGKIIGWCAVGLIAFLLLGIGARAINLFGLWADEAARIVSPTNVKEQFTEVKQDWQILKEAADKVCQAQGSTEAGRNAPTFVEDPFVAMKNAYYTARSDYNRRMNNLFEGEKVGPPGYPRYVPEIKATITPKGNWCEVSRELTAIHP